MSEVMLVEDDSWQAEHMARQLSQAGHTVRVAPHAVAAIEAIDQRRPDVIVLDMFLPGANGMTLLHEIRSHSDLADIPVVICSTESLDDSSLRPYGVTTVLDKTTMTAADLVAAVRKAVL